MISALRAALFIALQAALFAADPPRPLRTIPVGDSPFALALTSDETQAVVVNLFAATESPNVRVVDVNAGTTVRSLRVGTRLVAVTVAGLNALVVNEDQDVVRIVDLSTGREVAQVPVGSRPSNVATVDNNTAMVVNGTSGDISFIDIAARRTTGAAFPVGGDPRGAAVHPAENGRYAYIALGAENAIAVVDLRSTPRRVVTRLATGKSPVAVAISSDGRRAVTANVTNNTVTVFDTTDPASPAAIGDVPVGVQPTVLAANPRNPAILYVSNVNSPFVSVLDLTKPPADMLTGVITIGENVSGIRVNRDATRLYVLEFKNQANLRVYDLANIAIDPKPAIDVPGEPRLVTYVPSTGDCASSFYIAEAVLGENQREGLWGMEVLVSRGALTGGFNLGGGLERNGLLPSFGAFLLGSPQQVTVTVTSQPLTPGPLELEVSITTDGRTVATQRGASPLSVSAGLPAGFHVVSIRTTSGSPRAVFQLSASAPEFVGGVVVGGFIMPNVSGFGAFCVPAAQNIDVRLVARGAYGIQASGDLLLNLRNGQRELLRAINNTVAPAVTPTAPAPPVLAGLTPRLFVDAAAAAGGDGSQARPFRSITQAVNAFRAGDTILVRSGRYAPSTTGEVVPISIGRSDVQLIGEGAATTIIDAEGRTRGDGNGNAVVVAGSNTRFAGFTVRRASQAGLYIFRASGVVIENNVFASNVRFGLGGVEARGVIVRNNVADSNLETGIAFSTLAAFPIANAPANCAAAGGPFGGYFVNNNSSNNRADGFLLTAGGSVCVANNVTANNGSSGIEFNNRTEGAANAPLTGAVLSNTISNNGGVQFGFAGTGVLITEGAEATLIADNLLTANRPFGIGVFLNGRAGVIRNNRVSGSSQQGILVQRGSTAREISNNDVRDNGQSGLFVENQARVDTIVNNVANGNSVGLSVLDRSSAGRVESNDFSRNDIGIQLAVTSTGENVRNNTIDSNRGGVFMDRESVLTAFEGNKVRNNRDLGGIAVGASTAAIGANEISGTLGTGVTVSGRGRVTLTNTVIDGNGDGGVSAFDGAAVTAAGVRFTNNIAHGAQATGAGSTVTLGAGVSITGTRRTASGSAGYGIISTAGGAVTCTAAPALSGNAAGNLFGTAQGCIP
jgi:parallel beta-helix repeat protein